MHCKMGGRSAKAVELLRQTGFKKVQQHDRRHSRPGAIRSIPAFPKY